MKETVEELVEMKLLITGGWGRNWSFITVSGRLFDRNWFVCFIELTKGETVTPSGQVELRTGPLRQSPVAVSVVCRCWALCSYKNDKCLMSDCLKYPHIHTLTQNHSAEHNGMQIFCLVLRKSIWEIAFSSIRRTIMWIFHENWFNKCFGFTCEYHFSTASVLVCCEGCGS